MEALSKFYNKFRVTTRLIRLSKLSILSTIILVIIINLINFSSIIAADNTATNPYYKRSYPGKYSSWVMPLYRSDYDYYDPYVRFTSSVYVLSDYNYFTTPYSYYYYR